MNGQSAAGPGTIVPTTTGLQADLNAGFTLQIDVLENWLLRVALVPVDGLMVDRTWMVAPETDPVLEGRDRLSLAGFSCPAAIQQGETLESETFQAAKSTSIC